MFLDCCVSHLKEGGESRRGLEKGGEKGMGMDKKESSMVGEKYMFFFVQTGGVEFDVGFGGGDGKGEGVEPGAEDGVNVWTEDNFLELVDCFCEEGVAYFLGR